MKIISTLIIGLMILVMMAAQINYLEAIEKASHQDTDGEIREVMQSKGFLKATGTPADEFNLIDKLNALIERP
jgi:hypothetical protein